MVPVVSKHPSSLHQNWLTIEIGFTNTLSLSTPAEIPLAISTLLAN